MPNEVLDCICNAAHYNLIPSVSTLAKETRWHLAKEYGQKVIDIISEMQPAPLSPSPLQTPSTAPKTNHRELTCSSCNQPGHSSKFFEQAVQDKLILITKSAQSVVQTTTRISLIEPRMATRNPCILPVLHSSLYKDLTILGR